MPGRAFLDAPTPIPFAHRGGAEEAPENTMAAFELAVDLGYRYIETDVHLTGDGILVAFHDDVLDRVTNVSGRIAGLTLEQIREADAGYHFSTDGGATHPFRDKGLTVPTLEELLSRWPQVRVNIDTKADGAVVPLLGLIERLDVWDRVCIGSFSSARLRRIRRLSGNRLCTSMGPRAVAVARLLSLGGRMPAAGADCVQVPVIAQGVRIVDRAFVAAAHRAGLHVHVWTISDEAEMERLIDLGVDGIMTDRPRLLRDVLSRRGLWEQAAAAT